MLKTPIVVLLCILLPGFVSINPSFAEVGDKLTVEGYRFHISGDQRGSTLTVRGTVSCGERCRILTIDIYLRDDNGNIAHVTPSIQKYSGTSRKFSATDSVSASGGRWHVSNVYVKAYK